MKKNFNEIKTLLIYQVYRPGINLFYEGYIKRLNEHGFNVEGFCITIEPPAGSLPYSRLNELWKRKDKRLLRLYEQLKEIAKNKDVIVLYNGANIHPEFLKELSTFNAYMCFDDPESSYKLSEPVAKYFDACFIGNIACLNLYESWGCKNIFYRPLGYFDSHIYSSKITQDEIFNRNNTIDVCLFCERESTWRKERLDFLSKNIPNLYARGRGWSNGWVSDDDVLNIYSKSKIGINLHNSVGPVNLRTFTLPANGLMQICDNKFFLGHIFNLGTEVIGFNEIGEVPELVNYYLKNDVHRKRIAYAGWLKVTKEYNEIALWKKQMSQIRGLL